MFRSVKSIRTLVGYSLAASAISIGSILWWENRSVTGLNQVYAQQAVTAEVARSGLQNEALAGADQLSAAFRSVAKSLKPSVVSIKSVVEQRTTMTRGGRRSQQFQGIPPEFRRFFGDSLPDFDFSEPDGQPGMRRQEGTGSGVIVSSDGHILTNNHVVEGATKLEVQLSDKRVLEATVIGTDPKSDIALIKIDATGLVAAPIGDSSWMQVGDWVIAIGSPFELSQTVTSGIVSATNRDDVGITAYDDFIQTDAAINPGNSGGPLLNLRGEVIGINTAIASRSGGFNGIGFAIPSNTADLVMKSILKNGKVTRGFIGTQIGDINEQNAKRLGVPANTQGAVISMVSKDGPADKGGLQPGDIVTAVNGEKVESSSRLRRMVAAIPPNTRVKFDVLRHGKSVPISIVIEEQTDEKLAALSGGGVMNALGISVKPLTREAAEELGMAKQDGGVLVSEIERESPLTGKIRPGEVIVSVNDQVVSTPEDLAAAIGKGQLPILMVVRNATSSRLVEIR